MRGVSVRWLGLLMMCVALPPLQARTAIDELALAAPGVSPSPMRVRVLLPPGYAEGTARYPVLYMNDGQDLRDVGVEATLQWLYADNEIEPLIVVAIDMPPDRMGGYGLFDRSARHAVPAQTKYGPVGLNAQAYAQWVTTTLVPVIDARYRTRPEATQRAIVGWSLGGLSAFGIGWQYPELFGRIGAFSPSFWVSADRSDVDSIQATRLVHRLVDASAPMPRPKLFFAVGAAEEINDRDRDGVIDVLDDTRDLITGWQAPDGTARRGLRQWGYSVNLEAATFVTNAATSLYVLKGGHHDQASWARMFPEFLTWAYGNHERVGTGENAGSPGGR